LANGNDGPFLKEARHSVPANEEPLPLAETDADILWTFDMIRECGVRQHDQAHSSILIHGDHLYVNTSNGVDDSHKQIHAPDAPSLIVLDKRTGRLVATDGERIGPRVFHSTWSSPALARVNGRPLILFCGGDGVVYAFDPVPALTSDGAGQAPAVAMLNKVWQFDFDPSAPKENVHRYNSNRQEGPSNINSMPVFHAGRVYVTAGGDLWWGKNEAWLKCIDATGTGDLTNTGEVWSHPLDRHSMSTPAVVDGLVFVADCSRRLHCVEAATGRALWTHEANGPFWASPLVADGKVFIGSRRGDFWILSATREKRVLAEVALGSPVSGTATAANGVLYVASMEELYAIDEQP
jgi:outer membrane protein assembly factor BamB